MLRAYREKNWPQRSKIARAWMVWVARISMAFVPVSYLLAPDSFWLVAAISGLLVPALHACAYMVWRKPISAAVEGLALMLLMSSVMIAYGVLAVAAGGSDYERFLTCIMYVNTIAIVVFNVGYGLVAGPDGLLHGNLLWLRNLQSRLSTSRKRSEHRCSMRWGSMRRPSRGRPRRSSLRRRS